jgi:hypothetical protein
VAQKVVSTLVDDLDGSAATETVTFGLDGVTYEIDLTEEHANQLREGIATFVENGRRTGGRMLRGRHLVTSNGAGRSRTGNEPGAAQVREWAKKKRKPINDRGRVPQSLIDEYKAAHKLT